MGLQKTDGILLRDVPFLSANALAVLQQEALVDVSHNALRVTPEGRFKTASIAESLVA